MDSKNSMNITDNILASCRMYDFAMRGIIGGSISVIGIVCYIVSLIVLHQSVIKTPTTYQLQWLAFVDTIFLVLCFFCENVPYVNALDFTLIICIGE